MLLIWPFGTGFVYPFFGVDDRRRRIAFIGAFAPAVLIALLIVLFQGIYRDLSSMAIIGIVLVTCYMPFTIGRLFGKSFAAIRRERSEEKVRQTFK